MVTAGGDLFLSLFCKGVGGFHVYVFVAKKRLAINEKNPFSGSNTKTKTTCLFPFFIRITHDNVKKLQGPCGIRGYAFITGLCRQRLPCSLGSLALEWSSASESHWWAHVFVASSCYHGRSWYLHVHSWKRYWQFKLLLSSHRKK